MVMENLPRLYETALVEKFQKCPDVAEFMDIKFPVVDDMEYRLLEFIGEGASGKVYRSSKFSESKTTSTTKFYALKIFKGTVSTMSTTKINEIKKEMKTLDNLKSSIHIIKLFDVFICDEKLHMVFEYMDSGSISTIIHRRRSGFSFMDDRTSIKFYFKQILKAIDHCHSNGIIHFDVKPGNLVIENSSHTLKLIDFGHARFYLPCEKYSCDLGTVSYRSPEMLFGCNQLHYSVDMWSIGCIFLQMLFPEQARRFFSSDPATQVNNLNSKFGHRALNDFCKRYDLVCFRLSASSPTSWTDYLFPAGTYGSSEKSIVSDDALDLLNKLLTLDPIDRINSREAMSHPFII